MRRSVLFALVVGALIAGLPTAPRVDAQVQYQRITGEGSSFAANAIDAWRVALRDIGLTVDYNPSGSTAGRQNFLNGSVQFAASDLPFQFAPEDGSAPEEPPLGRYGYVPATAGGTAFVYNLSIEGQRVTNLRLSGENVTRIFTGVITRWNDPALVADNPGLRLPDRVIVPVVRSDGAGTTSQLTSWMIARHGQLWNDYCAVSGRAPQCGPTSFYPTVPGMIAQAGDLGVAGYVSQAFAEGAIGYTNYSYAVGARLPVAKLLNAAGFYTEPTPDNVSVSLSRATINDDPANPETYLTPDLSTVYTSDDPRNYELSSYSFLIVRTGPGQYSEAEGRSVAAFATYGVCQGQQAAPSVGYAPLPINLVRAAFDQISRIPSAEVGALDVASCGNPTFSPDGTNLVVQNAPLPPACDAAGGKQCSSGTGGLADVPTVTLPDPDSGGIVLEPSSGSFTTPFALRFDPLDQTCPGDGPAGWASSTFLSADTPSRLVHDLDGEPSSPAGGRTMSLRDALGVPVRAAAPAASTGGVPDLVDLSFEQTVGATPLDPGVYDVGVSCWNADTIGSVGSRETARYWSARIAVTESAGEFAYVQLADAADAIGPVPVVVARDVFEGADATISWTVPVVTGVPEPISFDVTVVGPTTVAPIIGLTDLTVTIPSSSLALGSYTVRVTPKYAATSGVIGSPGGDTFNVNPDALIYQPLTVTRPAGALILTQRCGVANALPAFEAVDEFPGFPASLPAEPATADQLGTSPDIDPDTPGIQPDLEFPNYPLPNPPAGPATYPTACSVDIGVARLVTEGSLAGQFFRAAGRLNAVTVLDTRDLDAGWVLRGDVEERFTSVSTGDSFSGDYLGWQPIMTDDSDVVGGEGPNGIGPLYDQTVTGAGGVLPGSGFGTSTVGMTDNPLLASSPAGAGLGIATLDARLTVLVPVSVDAADYSATLTLTLA